MQALFMEIDEEQFLERIFADQKANEILARLLNNPETFNEAA